MGCYSLVLSTIKIVSDVPATLPYVLPPVTKTLGIMLYVTISSYQ